MHRSVLHAMYLSVLAWAPNYDRVCVHLHGFMICLLDVLGVSLYGVWICAGVLYALWLLFCFCGGGLLQDACTCLQIRLYRLCVTLSVCLLGHVPRHMHMYA